MSTNRIYCLLLPLGCVNILLYYIWGYFMKEEPALLQYTVLQIFVNGIAAMYIVKHIKKDDFY